MRREIPIKGEDSPIDTLKIESQHYTRRTLQEIIDMRDQKMLFEWFEDSAIVGDATLELKTVNGIESATLKQWDPKKDKYVEYYTTDAEEVERFKSIKQDKLVKVGEN